MDLSVSLSTYPVERCLDCFQFGEMMNININFGGGDINIHVQVPMGEHKFLFL